MSETVKKKQAVKKITYYTYAHDTCRLLSHDTYQENNFPTHFKNAAYVTTTNPSITMMKRYQNNEGNLIFDPKAKTWSFEAFDTNKLAEKYANRINILARTKIRDGFMYNEMVFSTDDNKCQEYTEIAVCASLGILSYPIEIKASGDRRLAIKNIDDVKNFMTSIRQFKQDVRNACRILKYGGEYKGVEYKSLHEKNIKELASMNVDEAFEQMFSDGFPVNQK